MFKKRNSIGVMLIELMIALMLMVILLSTVIKFYLLTENNRLRQFIFISMEENAEILSHILKNRIEQTGYFGCIKLSEQFPFKNHLPFNLTVNNKIIPYFGKEVKPGTDAIQIWNVGGEGAQLIQNMQDYSSITLRSEKPIAKDDRLMISDCKTAETFEIKKIISLGQGIQKIILKTPLTKLYEKNAEVNMLEIEAFFVGLTHRLDAYHHPIFALYSKNIDGEKTELVEGVSQMKIFFSIVENNQLREYKISELHDASQIVALSFAFELSSMSTQPLKKFWNTYVAL